MENLRIEPSKRTPDISFDCHENLLEIRGKSFPANSAEYYEPVFSWLKQYLEQVSDQQCVLSIELIYFNSSSARILMELFILLEEAVGKGKNISVNWIYDEEDEDNLEYGEEFQEDFPSLAFYLVQKPTN
ncbi:MAG: hypothetical protein B6245_12670 [Desulfobacteraceae bacterium 4572_88]|nr:MAG: hypothetical protein B6245_12670 [Desulfobacteraceae bacterium 4572_88]